MFEFTIQTAVLQTGHKFWAAGLTGQLCLVLIVGLKLLTNSTTLHANTKEAALCHQEDEYCVGRSVNVGRSPQKSMHVHPAFDLDPVKTMSCFLQKP